MARQTTVEWMEWQLDWLVKDMGKKDKNIFFEKAKKYEKQQIRDLMVMAIISVADAFEANQKFEMEHIDQIIENYFT